MSKASLNHTYRLVWSDRENAYIAVSEITKSRGKSSTVGAVLTALCGLVQKTKQEIMLALHFQVRSY